MNRISEADECRTSSLPMAGFQPSFLKLVAVFLECKAVGMRVGNFNYDLYKPILVIFLSLSFVPLPFSLSSV